MGINLLLHICRNQCVYLWGIFQPLFIHFLFHLKKVTKIYPLFLVIPKWCPHLLKSKDKFQSTQIPHRVSHEEKFLQQHHTCKQLHKKQKSFSCMFTRASVWLVKLIDQQHAWCINLYSMLNCSASLVWERIREVKPCNTRDMRLQQNFQCLNLQTYWLWNIATLHTTNTWIIKEH